MLLPKTPTPSGWSDTRLITISSALLKWLAQLLLHRTNTCWRPSARFSGAPKAGSQLRCCSPSGNWQGWLAIGAHPFIIVKLDVKKAFPSASQCSMSDLISVTTSGNTGTHARHAFGFLSCGFPGGLLSALIGRQKHYAAGYMDDVYVWGETPEHVQEIITVLEAILAEHGLYINHVKKWAPAPDRGAHGDHPRVRSPYHGAGTTPVSFAGGPAHLMAEMSTRARKAFYANKKTLCAKTKEARQPSEGTQRDRARGRIVGGTHLADTRLPASQREHDPAAAHPSHDRAQSQARRVLARVEHQDPASRKGHTPQVGDTLESIWNLWGHVGRAPDTTTRDLLTWKGMQFWTEEQRNESPTTLERGMQGDTTPTWTQRDTSQQRRTT